MDPGANDTPGLISGSRGALTVLLAAATMTVMSGAVIAPVVALIRHNLGLSAGAAGLVITMHSLFIALSGPAVGALIDRVGTKRVLVPGLVAYAGFGGAGALAAGYPLLLVLRAAFGIAAALVINGVTVSLLNMWHGRARDTVMGYRTQTASAASCGRSSAERSAASWAGTDRLCCTWSRCPSPL